MDPDLYLPLLLAILETEAEDRSRSEFLNHPPFNVIREWCRRHLPQYEDWEIVMAWFEFQGIADDGLWRWGDGHVNNWMIAMKLRMQSNREPRK